MSACVEAFRWLAIGLRLEINGSHPAVLSTREGLLDTPERVVRAYEEWFAGYNEEPAAPTWRLTTGEISNQQYVADFEPGRSPRYEKVREFLPSPIPLHVSMRCGPHGQA